MEELRNLADWERQVLDELLQRSFPGSEQLKAQMSGVLVQKIDSEGSLKICARSPVAEVLQRIPVEGEYKDRDGVTVHLLLHVVDGLAVELEIYKDDGSDIGRLPLPNELRVSA